MKLNSQPKRFCWGILILPLFCNSLLAQPTLVGGTTKISINDLILLHVAITDSKGKYLDGQPKESFSVYRNREQQPIVYFSDKEQPVAVVFVIEKSGRMLTDTKGTIALTEAISQFVKAANPHNEYSVLSFNLKPHLQQGWTEKADELLTSLRTLDSQKPQGSAALFNACMMGIEQAKGSHSFKRAVIVITNGVDIMGAEIDDLKRIVWGNNVMLYAIDVERWLHPTKRKWLTTSAAEDSFAQAQDKVEDAKRRMFYDLSMQSGGQWFKVADQHELTVVFGRIIEELRHQYVIAIRVDHNKAAKKLQPIKIVWQSSTPTTQRETKVFLRHRQ